MAEQGRRAVRNPARGVVRVARDKVRGGRVAAMPVLARPREPMAARRAV